MKTTEGFKMLRLSFIFRNRLNHNSAVILQLNSLQPGELLLNPKQPGGA
jgi:hypothetical protein